MFCDAVWMTVPIVTIIHINCTAMYKLVMNLPGQRNGESSSVSMSEMLLTESNTTKGITDGCLHQSTNSFTGNINSNNLKHIQNGTGDSKGRVSILRLQ